MKSNLEVIKTADGSSSLYHPELNVWYHSVHGALSESRHVFINNGLHQLPHLQHLRILEVGMCTGLNLLLTSLDEKSKHQNISYTAIEPHPLSIHLVEQLQIDQCLNDPEARQMLELIHQQETGVAFQLRERFVVKKLNETIQNTRLEQNIHLIYYDAFAPSAQPELWTTTIFRYLYDHLVPGGFLVTYCAKGEVKRNLKQCGFKVEALPGPPRKREMTKATKV